MIEIRTGVPGAGKTSTLISDVMAEQRRSRRPVYYCNIPDCSVPGWQEFPDPTCWKKLPRDAILVVDDAHFGFTVRQFNVLAPKHVKELSDHGRYGLDIYLVALDFAWSMSWPCSFVIDTFTSSVRGKVRGCSRPPSRPT